MGINMKKMSIFENKLFEFLELQNIPFQREYKNETLINENGYHLYIDFLLPDFNIAIEVNGLHHYEAVDTYKGNAEYKFQRQLMNDKIKRDWCKKNNIKLIEFDVRDNMKFLFRLIQRRVSKSKSKKNEKFNKKNNQKNQNL